MPAEVLRDPLALKLSLPGEATAVLVIGDSPNPKLAADLTEGLAASVHPHGPLAKLTTVKSFAYTLRRMVRELAEDGFTGSAAELTRTVLGAFWLRSHHLVEYRTRTILRAFDTRHQALAEPVRQMVFGTNCTRPALNRPLPPYAPDEWTRLIDLCKQEVRRLREEQQAMVALAEDGQDPAVGGWSEANGAWLMLRMGPVTRTEVAAHLGITPDLFTKRHRGIERVGSSLLPSHKDTVPHMLLLAAWTGIVPDGLTALEMPGVRWAGRQATLLSYTKGRTAEESLVLSLRASRLLEQWLRHGAQLRRHAPAELAEHVWLVTRQGKLARAAFEEYMMRAWVKAHDLRGDDGQLLRIDRRRLRTTFIAQRGQRQWSPRATIDPNHSPEAELLSADRHRPGFRPWGKRSPRVVSGAPARPQVVIKTKPLDDDVLRPLLTACVHLVDVLGPHIVPLRTTLQAEREARRNVDWSRNLRDAEGLASLVDAHLRTDQPLPRLEGGQVTKRLRSGWDPKDPLLDVNFQQLLRPTGHRDISKALLVQARTLLEEAVAAVGTEYVWCRNAPDAPRADTGELIPWSLPLSNTGVDSLIRVAGHACTVATSALTGMRSSELMELTVGCRRTDDADGTGLARHRLVSKVVKGRLWGGEMDAWVVIEEVVRVIALAEQLTDARPGKPLFGPFNGFESNGAMTWLRQWVASAAGRRMGLDPIPDEPVHPRRLRRTLSVEMAARPGGLLATKVHFKHLQVATSEGYLRLPLMVEDGLGAARTARRRCVSNSAAPGPRQLL
ncbi:hypothetical protein [Streptomyces broussonetiae]|uniref:hypothetical protein n=1 Tax=Streptomyces broussonetiae TaxID=2686304 RepID=UPI0035DF8D93